jgi:hypothetical protein
MDCVGVVGEKCKCDFFHFFHSRSCIHIQVDLVLMAIG